MNLILENYNVRQTSPIILGKAGLPKNTERYVVSGMEMIFVDLFKDDELSIINIEGSQVCEMTFFNNSGNLFIISNPELASFKLLTLFAILVVFVIKILLIY